jgi:protein gp37
VAENSTIEWTDITWNFITGCTKISDGCLNCYIEKTMPFRIQGRRFDQPGIGGTTGVKLHSDRLHWPLTKWKKPSRIFVNSLADIFHEHVPDQFIAEAFAVMSLAPQHQFQVLTKRHARMRSLLNSGQFWTMVNAALWQRAKPVLPGAAPYILPNVHIGVSVETQQWADIRIPALLDTPAAVRWLSCEPLLGALDLNRWLAHPTFNPAYRIARCGQQSGHGQHVMEHGPDEPRNCPGTSGRITKPPLLDWVVVGGESGPGARPMRTEWARSLRDQCVAAKIAYLFKQWGAWVAPSQMPEDTFMSWDVAHGNDACDTDRDQWRFSKKAAGRLLDGREWNEYPRQPEAVTA